jgi:hypothetical protein
VTATGKKTRALLVLPALLGCDIVQGFQDAGDALFPEQSTHLSTPALRLVEGGYKSIAFAAGRELSVLARPADDSGSLFVMRFANPEPCEIRDVGRFVASRNPNRAEAGIAYFHEDATQGTLHFADTSCKTFDFAVDDARLPVGDPRDLRGFEDPAAAGHDAPGDRQEEAPGVELRLRIEPQAACRRERQGDVVSPRAVEAGAGTVCLNIRRLTLEVVEAARKADLKIIGWVVNTQDHLKLVRALELDGATTDYPEIKRTGRFTA